MKIEHKLILLSVLAALLAWSTHAIVDTFVFGHGTFPDMLIFHIPRAQLLDRSLAAGGFLLCGLVVAAYAAKRRRLVGASRRSEREKAAILNSMTEHVVLHDTDFVIQWVNRVAADSLGMAPSEVTGRHCYELWQQRTTPCENCAVLKAMKTGQPQQAETTSPDGRIWVVRGYPLQDEDGKMAGVVETTLEITERTRAERALEASEARYRLLAENVTDAIWTSDMELRFTYVSPSAEPLTGYTCEELLSAPVTKILTKASFETVSKVFAEELAVEQSAEKDLGRSRTLEVELKRKDDSTIWGEIKATFIRDADGRATGLLGVARDVTERRRATEALRESEANFRALAENVMDGILIFTGEGRTVYANKRSAEMLGYSASELLNTEIRDLAHPAELGRLMGKYRKRLQGRYEPTRYETVGIRKDGTVVPVEISATRSVWRGQPADVAIVRDITASKRAQEALRESEERFRNLMEYIPGVSIQGYRTDGTVFYWNKASEEVYGYTAEEAIGKNLGDLIIPPHVKPHFENALKLGETIRKSGEFMPPGELLLLHKKGHLVPVYSIHTAVYIEGREATLFCIDVDLSERQKIEEALRQYQKAVEGSEDFIAAVDRDYTYLLVNDAFLRYHQLTRDSVVGRHVASVGGDEVFEREIKPRADQCFRGDTVRFEMLDQSPVLGERCMEVLYHPLKGDGEEPTGLVAIMRDITERKHAEEHLRYRLEFEDLITSISTRFINLAPDEIDEQINDALRRIGEFAGVDRSYVFLFSEDGTTMDNTHEWCGSGIGPQSGRMRNIPVDRFPWACGKLKNREVLHVPRVADLPAEGEKKEFQFQGIQSLINVPMVMGPSVAGFLGLDSVRTEKTWPDEVVALLRNAGEVIANAIARVRAEEALRGSEERYRVLVETMKEGLEVTDEDYVFTYVNKTFAAMLGCSREEMIGHHITEFVHQDYQEVMAAQMTKRREGDYKPYELAWTARDGQAVYTLASPMGIFEADGRFVGSFGVLTDITERKRAEDELRVQRDFAESLVEIAHAIIFILDPQGRVLRANRFAQEATGYTEEEMRSKDAFDLFLPLEERPRNRLALTEILGGRRTPGVARSMLTRDGREILVRWYASAIRGAEGEVTGVLAIGHDITEIQEKEQQLRQAATMEAIGRLAGGIAHDFNNMLAVVQGYADLLSKSMPAEDSRQADLEKIRNATERATGLARQLLALGRKQVVQPRVLQLNETILGMDSMLRRTMGDDIELTTTPAEDLWHVMADPTQLEQVILNLVVNAREAMPDGGTLAIETVNVTLDESQAVEAGLSPGEHVLLTVTDTGVGMGEDVRSHIFEPFFSTKKVGGGTGLGLSTCYGIIKQSGGHITVHSGSGEGTTIRIYLPRVERIPAEGAEVGAETGGLPRGTESVLVVEDQQAVRELTCRVLREQGYQVLDASDAEEAIAMATEEPRRTIDLLLTDVVMPRVGGKELAERFRTIRRRTRVLFISGYPDDALVHRGALEAGVNFLAKPFSPRELAEAVRRVLDATEGKSPAESPRRIRKADR